MNMNSLLFIFLGLLSFCVNDEDFVKVKPINESFIEVIYQNYLESKNIDYQDLNTIDVYQTSGRKDRIASAYADKILQVTGSVDNQKLSPTNIVARLDSCSIEKLKINFIPNSNATTITKTIPVFIFYDSITKLEKKFNKHKSICRYENATIKYQLENAHYLIKLCLSEMKIQDGGEWIDLPSEHIFVDEKEKSFKSSQIPEAHSISIPHCHCQESAEIFKNVLKIVSVSSGVAILIMMMIVGTTLFIRKKRSSENEVKETATVDVNELYGTDYTGEEEYYDDTEVKDYNDYYEE